MASFKTEISFKDLDKYTKKVVDDIRFKATPSAINRALASTKTFASRLIREKVNIKNKDLDKSIELNKASRSNPQGSITFFFGRVPLSNFSPKQKIVSTPKGRRKGVTVDISGSRKLVRGAFLATVGSGHIGIFKRRTDNRLPITELTTGVLSGFVKDGTEFSDKVRAFAENSFQENMERNIEFYLNKGSNSEA